MLDTSRLPFWDSLMEGIVRKEYELLTGAGFSRDARDRRGRPLPLGDTLRDELMSAFSLPAPADTSRAPTLTQVYGLCQSRHSSPDKQTVFEWLNKRFSRTRPPQWYQLIRDMSFNTIWTLNIDDALNNALDSQVRTFHYLDKTITVQDDKTALVHLHGQASKPERGLVFALDEYVSQIKEPRPFANRFQESLTGSPFIVVGANLSAEVDIATSLKGRMPEVDKYPSVIVRPNFDEFSKLEVESWGFKAVPSTAEDFFRAIHRDFAKTMRRLAPAMAAEEHVSPLNSRFAHQWALPNASKAPRGQNLLAGDEPFYSDIKQNATFARTLESEIVGHVTHKGGIALLRGSPYSGKSTLALRVARLFEQKNWNVFVFQGDGDIDVDATLAGIRNYPNTFLLVDDAGLFAKGVLHLIDEAESRSIALHLLCVDRDGPATRLRRHSVLKEFACNVRMPNSELESYIQLLDSRDLLNQQWRTKSPREFHEQLGSDFVSIISRCVVGQTFENRVRREMGRVGDTSLRSALLLSCIFSRVSKGVDTALVARTLGLEMRELITSIERSNGLSSLVRINDQAIRPRHHRLAEALFDSQAFDGHSTHVLSDFAKVLSSRVDPGAIRKNTRYYRMAVRILDHELLNKLVGSNRVDEIYEAIEVEYTWNSRYWEQRALAASARFHYEDAVAWSDTALSVYRDAYSLNTSAAILFKYLRSPSIPSDRLSGVASRAISRVTEARDMSREDSEYPFVTFLHNAPHLLRLARDERISGLGSQEVIEKWRTWYVMASESIALNYPDGTKKLRTFERAWRKALGRS